MRTESNIEQIKIDEILNINLNTGNMIFGVDCIHSDKQWIENYENLFDTLRKHTELLLIRF